MSNPLMGMISQELFNDAQLHRFTAAEEGVLDGIKEKLKGISKALKNRNSEPMADGVEALYDAKYKADVEAIRAKIIKDVKGNAARLGIDPKLQELNGGNGAEIDCIGYDFKSFANTGYWNQIDKMPKELRCPESDSHGDSHLDWETKAVHWLSEQLFGDVVKKYDREIKRVYPKAQVTYDVFSDSPNMVTVFIWFDKNWLEDQVPKAVAQESFQKGMSAEDFLAAYESQMALKSEVLGGEDNFKSAMESEAEAIHQGLEDTLQDEEAAPYDPTEELENIAQVLAGIDDGSDYVEQQDEEQNVRPQDNVENMMATPTDTDQAAGATEGLIQKLKNHRIPKNFWKENKVQANASSVKDAIDKFIASDTGSDYMDTFVVKVNDVVVGFRGDRKSQYQNDPELVKATERAIGQTSAVYKALVDSIIKDYNDSKGANGPWGWQDRSFKPTTTSEVRFNVRLNYIEADGKDSDGAPHITWWFDDGPHEIYGAHSLCVHTRDCFDTKGNFIKSKFSSTLEG